jgi:hypothetical protein
MEKAMVALLVATKNDVSRLQKLAEISSADPDFIDEYEKRLRQRERVRLNQKVGTSIEALFKYSSPFLTTLSSSNLDCVSRGQVGEVIFA